MSNFIKVSKVFCFILCVIMLIATAGCKTKTPVDFNESEDDVTSEISSEPQPQNSSEDDATSEISSGSQPQSSDESAGDSMSENDGTSEKTQDQIEAEYEKKKNFASQMPDRVITAEEKKAVEEEINSLFSLIKKEINSQSTQCTYSHFIGPDYEGNKKGTIDLSKNKLGTKWADILDKIVLSEPTLDGFRSGGMTQLIFSYSDGTNRQNIQIVFYLYPEERKTHDQIIISCNHSIEKDNGIYFKVENVSDIKSELLSLLKESGTPDVFWDLNYTY